MKKTAAYWKSLVASAAADIESRCNANGVTVLRGSFLGEKIAIVLVDDVDWNKIAGLLGTDSICVLDFRPPPAPVEKDPDLRDLYYYIRLRNSDTWLCCSLETPEEDDPDEVPEDEIGYSWRRESSADESTLNTLAITVAKEIGFGGLKNKGERTDFSESVLSTRTELKLQRDDFWEIADRAETYFRTGVAPTQAKSLESEGKSVAEIARVMGRSKSRVTNALETNVPRHIAKLLASTQ